MPAWCNRVCPGSLVPLACCWCGSNRWEKGEKGDSPTVSNCLLAIADWLLSWFPPFIVISFCSIIGTAVTEWWSNWRVFPSDILDLKCHQYTMKCLLWFFVYRHLCWSQLLLGIWSQDTWRTSQPIQYSCNPIGLFQHLLWPCNCMHTACTNLAIVVKPGIFIIEMGFNYMGGSLNHTLICRLFYRLKQFLPAKSPTNS